MNKNTSFPWFNHSLKRLARRKQRLYNKAKTSGKQNDWKAFRVARKLMHKRLKEARKAYISDYLGEAIEENPTRLTARRYKFYHHLTNVTNLYLLAATETKHCYVTIKHLNLNFPQQCNLKVYSRWLWIFLSLKSPEEWEITKQACRDESVVFSYFQYLYHALL